MANEDLAVSDQQELTTACGSRKSGEQKITGKQKETSKIQDIEDRQNQVYLLRLRGFTNNQIAEKLQVSLSTVEKDLHEIKTNVVKAYKNFQTAGFFEAFQDACGQIDLIQNEMWGLLEKTQVRTERLNILRELQATVTKKLEIYKLSLIGSPLLANLENPRTVA